MRINTNDRISTLTKREYFAALAMQGILACPTQYTGSCSANALKYADALIEALNKEDKPVSIDNPCDPKLPHRGNN